MEEILFLFLENIKKTMNVIKLQEKLKAFHWLIGDWKSITAVINYPTMKSPINYNEKLSFSAGTSMGRPLLNYKSLTWGQIDGSEMHLETGFLRINEDATVTLIIAQSFGVATIEEGLVKDNSLITNSSYIGYMKSVKHKVVLLQRCYKLNESGHLEYHAMMETSQTPLQEHVSVVYDKCV